MSCFELLRDKESFFNFLSSHDGIGMRPVENILTNEEKEIIYNQARSNKGLFNYKSLPDGSKTIYEINCTYTDIIFKDNGSDLDYKRYLLAHIFIIFLRGVPAIYINSLLFQRNDIKYAEESKVNRNINRHLFTVEEFNNITTNKHFIKNKDLINHYLKLKVENPDFDPYSSQTTIKNLPDSIVGFIRNNKTHLLFNFSDKIKSFEYNNQKINLDPYDLIII
jgi:glucosylglycerate phosphorylase